MSSDYVHGVPRRVDDEIIVPSDKRCVMCGRMAAFLWTINNFARASVTYLCEEHGQPLMEIMDAAGEIPPDDQIPVPDRVPVEEPQPYKPPSRLVPLIDWTPPEEGFIGPRNRPAPPPGMSPEEILVKASREEGQTWQEIADVLGMTRQNVWFKYHQKYGGPRGSRKQAVS